MLLLAAITLATAQSAGAAFGIVPGSFAATAQDSLGNPLTQAGAHPDATTSFELNTAADRYGFVGPDEDLRDVRVELPVGVTGNTTAAPQCPMEEFATNGNPRCPTATQVGIVSLNFSGVVIGPPSIAMAPVFNLVPRGDEPARLGFRLGRNNVVIDTAVRTGSDYGITATVRNTPGGVLLYGSSLTLWGVPADPVHDAERFLPGSDVPGDGPTGGGKPIQAGIPPRAFFSNPTSCDTTPVTRIAVTSWQDPDTWVGDQAEAAVPTGCDRLLFEPSLTFQPGAAAAGMPSGYEAQLAFGQSANPIGLLPAALRNAVVKLPPGVVVAPGSADGLQGCGPQQIDLQSDAPPNCPPASTLGTVEVKTPLLADPLQGHIYLATPTPEQLLGVYLVAAGSGVTVKLAGDVDPDPQTGQLTATFLENPQVPVSNVELTFKSGPRAALANPEACDTYTTRGEFTPWSTPVAKLSEDQFTINQGCGQENKFAPTLRAGPASPLAGTPSPFVVDLRRESGQNLSRIDLTLPRGELAKLAGVALCPDAQAATGDCPAPSRVGDTTVAVGPGSNPLYVPQSGKAPTAVYLAGPYKGAPYSLVVKVPAQAGPFDLGTVAVRSAIHIDPTSTQVSVNSDPLPQILEGIPVSYRVVNVNLDRPDFTRNPTNCEAMSLDGTITSAQGTAAKVSAPFQVTNCAALGFKPSLALKLTGPTHRSAYPALKATLSMPQGGANIARAAVTLPKTEILEQAHIKTICTRVQYAANNCPAQSVYGYAKAWSPLLDQPLQGPVYLRSSSHKLPDLVASLDGQIHVDLQGRIDSVHARIRNTFDLVPDAPVSRFVLTMQGGKKGLLVNNTELCKAKPVADALFDGQNGKSADLHPVVKVDCGKGRKKK